MPNALVVALSEMQHAAFCAAECKDWPERRALWIADYLKARQRAFRLARILDGRRNKEISRGDN